MALCCFKQSDSLDIEEMAGGPEIDRSRFFVITTIFNPASFKKRYDLYHKFAAHMKDTGAQLITIECIFPRLGQNHFQVTDSNNPYHIQFRSNSIYWVKENLINIAVRHLPHHAEWVCWLDADIEFQDKDWIPRTIQQLKKFSVVQVFKKCAFLGPEGQTLRLDYSFGYSVVHGKIIDQDRYDEWYPHPGYGWAMAKSTFMKMDGLPDYDIVGSGDLHFAFSLLNRVSNAIEAGLNPEFKALILRRCREMYETLTNESRFKGKEIVGYVPITIRHHWHGSRKDRQYVDRWKILIAHDFNFVRDVWKLENGLLELLEQGGSTMSSNSLQEDIKLHFEMRKEDDTECIVEDNAVIQQKKPSPKKKHAPNAPHKYKHVTKHRSNLYSTNYGLCEMDGHSPLHCFNMSHVICQQWRQGNSFVGHEDDSRDNNSHAYDDHHHYPGCNDGHNEFISSSSDAATDHYDQCNSYGEQNYGNDYSGTITCTSQY